MSHLPAGKLPNDILAQLLSRISSRDPWVIVGRALAGPPPSSTMAGRTADRQERPITFGMALCLRE